MQQERPFPTYEAPYAFTRTREYTELRESVLFRLKPACEHFPPEEFEALVDGICVFKTRWGVR